MPQIATTIESSKRLIEAGLDPNSADMNWSALAFEKDAYGIWYPQKGTQIKLLVGKPEGLNIPAWSLSRLIDIIGSNVPIDGLGTSEAVIEQYVTYIVSYLKSGNIKEEYLVK